MTNQRVYNYYNQNHVICKNSNNLFILAFAKTISRNCIVLFVLVHSGVARKLSWGVNPQAKYLVGKIKRTWCEFVVKHVKIILGWFGGVSQGEKLKI